MRDLSSEKGILSWSNFALGLIAVALRSTSYAIFPNQFHTIVNDRSKATPKVDRNSR
jgi:hypothetical protein